MNPNLNRVPNLNFSLPVWQYPFQFSFKAEELKSLSEPFRVTYELLDSADTCHLSPFDLQHPHAVLCMSSVIRILGQRLHLGHLFHST